MSHGRRATRLHPSFSALQRAENSSINVWTSVLLYRRLFQCSSASRKFLNRSAARWSHSGSGSFSALQRAENSSIVQRLRAVYKSVSFSALQRAENSSILRSACWLPTLLNVSVLFSEPKIPQWYGERDARTTICSCFSALQRAENSSIASARAGGRGAQRFQCSSASRKFLNACWTIARCTPHLVSVLFSEPKIPQSSE